MDYLNVFKKDAPLINNLGGDKAHTAWVMALYLGESDVEALAAVGLTDGPNDKKIDFIYLDHDGKRIVFAQGYFSSKDHDSAPANKASDLNTAAAWLLSGDLLAIPENLRVCFEACRDALSADEIDTIELFYVHNLPESLNVARELQTAEDHLRNSLGSSTITVRASELGRARIQHLHDSQESHIDVKESIDFPAAFSFEEAGPRWKAYVTSVPGTWLHTIFTKFGDRLFSANYRGYLGSGRRRRVNLGIRDSAETRAPDFWAFNNGITILTMGVNKEKSGPAKLSGISIINGAQTTGSIGSVDLTKKSLTSVKVLCRVIESSDADTIAEIVRFNNTQNAITTWDQYANDPEQKRLAQEFLALGFDYAIKRGFMPTGDQLGIDEVIQPLLAFHGRPQDAVRGKNNIFDRKPLYQNAFEGKKARHVLLVYTLARAIDEKRITLKAKSNEGALIALESKQLSFMRNLRFKPFFIALMAATLETALGKPCDFFTVAFHPEAAKDNTLIELAARWAPVVETLLALITASPDAQDFGSKLSDDSFITTLAAQIGAMLYAVEASKKHEAFASLVTGT